MTAMQPAPQEHDKEQAWPRAAADRARQRSGRILGNEKDAEDKRPSPLADAEMPPPAADRETLRRELEEDIKRTNEELECLTAEDVGPGAVEGLKTIAHGRIAALNPFRPMNYWSDPNDFSLIFWPALWLLRPIGNLALAVGMAISSPFLFAAARHKDARQTGKLQARAFLDELKASEIEDDERGEIINERARILRNNVEQKQQALQRLDAPIEG